MSSKTFFTEKLISIRPEREKGFTLVELSIAIIIIGLLIGGILKGQTLIENARINASISQVQAYQAAVFLFKDSYQGIPGDLVNAESKVPDCNASTFCSGGDGSGRIGATVIPVNDVSGATENTQFWKHLALADMITGVDGTANPAGTLEFGKAYPKCKFNGGFQMLFSNQIFQVAGVNMDWSGHLIKMQNHVTGAGSEIPGEYATTPHVAQIIDTKMDDGQPGSGTVQTFDAGPGAAAGCEGPLPYDETFTTNNCTMLFFFKNL